MLSSAFCWIYTGSVCSFLTLHMKDKADKLRDWEGQLLFATVIFRFKRIASDTLLGGH